VFRFTAGKVRGRHRIPVIERRSAVSYPDRVPGGDGAMTGMSAIGGPAAGAAVRGLIDGRGMVAALDRGAGKR